MIKVQGLGHRKSGTTHAEAIAHHRNTHSKLGIGQADHMGKYVLYYFKEAFDSDGHALPDFPWDMSALEWFRKDDYWNNFQEWLASAVDGQEVMHDEASFLDREKCFMLRYDERVFVDEKPAEDDATVIMRLLKFAKKGPIDEAWRRAEAGVPEIKTHFGSALRKFVVNRITEPTCLATGKIPVSPVDVIQIMKIESGAAKAASDLIKTFATTPIITVERESFDVAKTINLTAEEVDFMSPEHNSAH